MTVYELPTIHLNAKNTSSSTKVVTNAPIQLNQPKKKSKSKARAVKFATVTTTLLGGALLATPAAPLGAALITATLPALAVEFLAPKTFEKVINVPGGTEVVAATAIGGPVAGAVVGLEQGTGFLQESGLSFGQALGVAGAGVATAAGAAFVAKDVFTTSPGELQDEIDKLEKKVAKQKIKDLEKQLTPPYPGPAAPAQEVQNNNFPPAEVPAGLEPLPTIPGTKASGKRRKKRLEPRQSTIRQTVNIYDDCEKKYKKRLCVSNS